MKIAYLIPSKIPSRTADSIHAMKMCNALASAQAPAPHGHSVTLIIPKDVETEAGVDNVYEYYGVAETFEIKRIALRLPKVPMLKSLRCSLAMARYIYKNGYECVLSRDFYACFFAAYVFHIPVALELHTPIKQDTLGDSAFRFFIKKRCLSTLILITEALKKQLLSQFELDERKIFIAPDGADVQPESITYAELAEGSAGKFQVGYIGHLYKGRGLELLGEMALSCPFAFFHIIGGHDRDVAYWKDMYSHIENIHFYGFVPPAQTVSYGKCMDVLIAPYQYLVKTEGSSRPESSTAKWMSPMKIFEYMALGKPIITSDLPVLKEVLTDGLNGVLCTPDDAAQWCDAIKRLFGNKELSRALADNAALSLQKYTWSARAKNILEYIGYDEAECESSVQRRSISDRVYIFRLLRVALLFVCSYISRIGNK